MSRRSFGFAIAAIGIVVLAVAALADQIGIGEADEFGWKQIVGVVVGVAIVVLGIIIATLAGKPANGVESQM
jgi:hypothetical protein